MRFTITFSLLVFCSILHAQNRQSDSVVVVPDKLPKALSHSVNSLDKKLNRQSQEYLKDFAKKEEKILSLLAKTDSGAAAQMQQSGKATYQKLAAGLQEASNKTERIISGDYIAAIDTLQGALGFLKDAKNVISKSKDIQQQLGSSLQNVNRLQNRLSEAANIQQIVNERQAALQNLLSSYTNLPGELTK